MKFSSNNPEINNGLKKFIESNIALIENKDFKELYKRAYATRSTFTVGHLTHVLYSIGIDPLDDLDYIPAGFLEACDALIEVDIPSHIEHIDESAFYDCNNLKEILIPKNVIEVASWSLADCDELRKIVILSDVKRIDSLAFSNNPQLEVIYCTESVSYMLRGDRKIIGSMTAAHVKIEVIR